MTRRKPVQSAAWPATMALGDFLVAYLQRAGVSQIFGLPGDHDLGLYHRFGAARGLEINSFSHEPSVGFAADGYARSTRKLGVVYVTYGAGGHNIVNAIAGAYAEQVPILVISGGPSNAEQEIAKIHHQVKDVEAQCRIFAELTCTAQIVSEPATAAEQIHEIVSTILAEMRPGYIEIHRDMVEVRIPIPKALREWSGRFPKAPSNKRKRDEAVAETIRRLCEAKRPLLLGGVKLYRERAEKNFRVLAEKLGAPVVTTMLAKGVFPMDHPLHMGVQMGSFGHPAIRKRVREADLVLALGAQRTDFNQGIARSPIRPEHSVWALDRRVEVSYHEYADVSVGDFTAALAASRLPRHVEKVQYYDNLKRPAGRSDSRPLSINDMLVELNDFLADCPGYDVVAESGDSLFGGLELRVPGDRLYLAQGYYASMGFAVPAAMGLQIGTGRRPLVLCGDGGFQMTGPDIAHAPRLRLSPLVVLVNNGGWGIFRPVTPSKEMLDLPSWPYAEFAKGWGGAGFTAHTAAELHEALRAAHELNEFVLVECRLPEDDLSPISRRYIRASAKKARVG